RPPPAPRRPSSDDAPSSPDADVAGAPIRHLFGHAPRTLSRLPVHPHTDDSVGNEPGCREERPTNRIPSRTARPPSSDSVGGSAELTQGRHHLRCETFLLLVAQPADPAGEDREAQDAE